MTASKALISGPTSANIGRSVTRALAGDSNAIRLRCTYHLINTTNPHSTRHFSSTPHTQLRLLDTQKPSTGRQFSSNPSKELQYFEPPKNAPSIKITPPAWHHPMYSEEDMKNIKIAHRESKTWSDWWALGFVRFFRTGMDIATGYRHDLSKPYIMNERKWMVRFVFLETVAGVPGMVAATLRHLMSLRRMQRDNGWIETLLEEAYNERMHLLTFLKMAEPGWFMKLMIIGAQGVFYNGFFLSYLISPRTCHRFVGYLEEEAVRTYTYAIKDIEEGRLPAWKNLQAPEIAIRYWKMPEGHQTMHDLLLYIRADEAKHREVNHTLGNLDQKQDPNPFVSEYKDGQEPHPSKGIEYLKPTGWERKEVL